MFILFVVQVPTLIFVTDVLPKTATGKIQRRHMVTAFITGNKGGSKPAPPAPGASGAGGPGPRSKL